MALQAWIRIGQPLEPVMNDYERIFDAWEAGGIKGFVFGRTLFADTQGQFTVPAFPSNPQAYRDRGLELNGRNTETDSSKEKLLHGMLDNAKARGWEIFIFAPGSGATGAKPLPLEEDPYGAIATAAVWDEVFGSFPQVDGGIMDGWTESAYELEWHHGNAVFADIPESTKAQAAVRGYDPDRLERGRYHLQERFRILPPPKCVTTVPTACCRR